MNLRQALFDRGINVFSLDVVVESVQPDEAQAAIALPGGWRLLAHPDATPEGKDCPEVRAAKWQCLVDKKTKARLAALASVDYWSLGLVSRFGFRADEVPPMVPFIHRSGRWFVLPPTKQDADR